MPALQRCPLYWYSSLGSAKSKALVGLHVFSGCDSVSSFRGKGKKTMLNKLISHESTFCQLGSAWSLEPELCSQIEGFVCTVYGQLSSSDINKARYSAFRLQLGSQSDGYLPPNKDSLALHLQRANYQCAILRRCLQPVINAPSPTDHGWLVEEGTLQIKWNNMPIVPECLTKFVSCKCKKSACASDVCSCHKAGLECTSICQCENCDNSMQSSGESSDSDGGDVEWIWNILWSKCNVLFFPKFVSSSIALAPMFLSMSLRLTPFRFLAHKASYQKVIYQCHWLSM